MFFVTLKPVYLFYHTCMCVCNFLPLSNILVWCICVCIFGARPRWTLFLTWRNFDSSRLSQPIHRASTFLSPYPHSYNNQRRIRYVNYKLPSVSHDALWDWTTEWTISTLRLGVFRLHFNFVAITVSHVVVKVTTRPVLYKYLYTYVLSPRFLIQVIWQYITLTHTLFRFVSDFCFFFKNKSPYHLFYCMIWL